MNEPDSLPTLAGVVFARITEFARRPVAEQVSSMPDLMVAKALEKDTDERCQDAHQLADGLRACLAEPGGHRPDADVTARLERTIADDGDVKDESATRTLRIGAEGEDTADAGMKTRTATASGGFLVLH